MNTISYLYSLYREYSSISTDTRNIKENSLFFCLKGEHFDGNYFVNNALEKGAAMVVTENTSFSNHPKAVIVPDALQTLQQLAKMHREHLGIRVLGITGTNGKTTTKELISAVLAQKYQTRATRGNLNNHIGVPLTLLEMNNTDEFAVIEMGANHPGEIADLCTIADPDCAVITNIGTAHIEGFVSRDAIFKTKIALYQHVAQKHGTLFVNTKDIPLTDKANQIAREKKCHIVSCFTENKDLKVIDMNPFLHVELFGEKIKTHFTGLYNVSNLLCAATVGHFYGVSKENICQAIADYVPSNHRSQVLVKGKLTLIADYYNANPSSMKTAIDSLVATGIKPRQAILGEMLELGTSTKTEHEKVVQYCKDHDIQALFIGENFAQVAPQDQYFATTEDFNHAVLPYFFREGILLVKGSRGVHLENLNIWNNPEK
ncbi:MAG: UDP-N-acetylmuramoyl-tripeptide--D-alanyl-D-alanine ligase [Bacteroidales bacterium]|jgi:UDP-N-acetylmuramoyl-tripeptide--D-alanyl-D-alanine ligase|nr:UDP-N-acetylmuramoyl-tripeptide--D-alanyl-D-alanine ligase [Bacteroidales bacterium]